MNRGLYTAATGMLSNQYWLDSVANNLSNASTSGYKRDEMTFEEGYIRRLNNGGGQGESVGGMQSGPMVSGIKTNWERGAIQSTGNGTDIAIRSTEGMFAVETPGGVRFTRAGAFSLNESRELVDVNGNKVLDDSLRPIRADGTGTIKISSIGEVFQDGTIFGRVAVFDGEFRKLGLNMFTVIGDAVPQDRPAIVPESIEGSNVNIVATMIEMVQVQRLFEMAQKSIQTHDESTSKLIESSQR
jgi:flagellar basal body rod protein FlgG